MSGKRSVRLRENMSEEEEEQGDEDDSPRTVLCLPESFPGCSHWTTPPSFLNILIAGMLDE